jgi:hypothetical protein
MYRSAHGMIKGLGTHSTSLLWCYCPSTWSRPPRRPVDGPRTHETNFPVHSTVTGPDFSSSWFCLLCFERRSCRVPTCDCPTFIALLPTFVLAAQKKKNVAIVQSRQNLTSGSHLATPYSVFLISKPLKRLENRLESSRADAQACQSTAYTSEHCLNHYLHSAPVCLQTYPLFRTKACRSTD